MAVLFTARGFREGIVLMRPALLPVSLFGMAVGAAAAQKGLSLAELTAMNALVFAGAAQLVALGLWQAEWNLAALVSITIVTFTVNARLILMSASMRPWLGPMPPGQAYPLLFFLTDANWIAAQRYRAEGGQDAAILLGSGAVLWIVWVVAPVPGHLLGVLIKDARSVGLDLVMPVFFTAMVARLWRGRSDSLAWIAAGAVGWLVSRQYGGAVHVVAGALVAMVIAAALAPAGRDAEAPEA